MYRADAHFRMGTSHEAEGSCCQDYALAENGRLPFAVVSDGCSTSGQTDIGARLWCLAARRMHSFSATALEYMSLMAPFVSDMRDRLGLQHGDLDATAGVIFALRDGGIRSILWGDGVMAARTPKGLEILSVEWAGNMPGYPSYELSGRKAAFLAESEQLAGDSAPCRLRYVRTGEAGTRWSDGFCADLGLKGMHCNWPPGTEVAAVLTDGVFQVGSMDFVDVVAELLSFGPAREGAFAYRRLNAALKRWAKEGHRPVDDISIAALVKVDV